MVLPGIQTLFGFQLVAVFSQGFKGSLSENEQVIHLLALLLVAVSAMLVVAPAAYHRQANHQISQHFIDLSSSLLAWAMVPLAIGTSLDIYIVTRTIIHSTLASAIVSTVIFALYTWTWFIFPQIHGRKIRNLPTHEPREP